MLLGSKVIDPFVQRVVVHRSKAAVSPCAPSGFGVEPMASVRVSRELTPVRREKQHGERDDVGVGGGKERRIVAEYPCPVGAEDAQGRVDRC